MGKGGRFGHRRGVRSKVEGMHDLVIRNGTVVDGSGADRQLADVAVTNGVITSVGEVEGAAARTIDAEGHLVLPGWVDVHTHYDGQVSWDPVMAPSSQHGVTSVVMGNCGCLLYTSDAADE